jgi:hypothetical protein
VGVEPVFVDPQRATGDEDALPGPPGRLHPKRVAAGVVGRPGAIAGHHEALRILAQEQGRQVAAAQRAGPVHDALQDGLAVQGGRDRARDLPQDGEAGLGRLRPGPGRLLLLEKPCALGLGPPALRDERADGQGHQGDGGHEGLEHEERVVLGRHDEGARAAQGRPGGRQREQADGGGHLALSEPEGGPHQRRQAEEGVVLENRRREDAARGQ